MFLKSYFGARYFAPRYFPQGNSSGEEPPPEDNTQEFFGGKPYHIPYREKKDTRKEIDEIKDAIDSAEIERLAIEEELKNADALKKKKIEQLEKKLLRSRNEILRLFLELQTLEALIREWDEEDALIALSMSNPFLTLKL